MKLREYIELNKLDKTDKDYNIKVLEYFGIDYSVLKPLEVIEKVKEISKIDIRDITEDRLKIDGKWFYIEKDITQSTFTQFITLDSYLSSQENFINSLNEILSIYVRPREWNNMKFKWEIEKFDMSKKKINDELLLEMDIDTAFSLNVFFYQNAADSIKNMKTHYLNEMMKKVEVTLR